jgi:O-antigen ligase
MDIGVTLAIITIAYAVLIKLNSHGWTFEDADSRWTFATLQWRVDFWKTFLKANEGISFLFGHGVGSADFVALHVAGTKGYPPHNDYLRVYYDTGIIGLICFMNLVFYVLRSLVRSSTLENDFIILMYLMIICFSITDNFIYVTNSLLLYIFMASYISRPSMVNQKVKI